MQRMHGPALWWQIPAYWPAFWQRMPAYWPAFWLCVCLTGLKSGRPVYNLVERFTNLSKIWNPTITYAPEGCGVSSIDRVKHELSCEIVWWNEVATVFSMFWVWIQGCSHQIWSVQIGSAGIITQYPRGAWEHASPENFWNSGDIRLLLRPFLDQHGASWRPDDRISHECHSDHCIVLHWCRLSDPVCLSSKSHTLRRWSLRD